MEKEELSKYNAQFDAEEYVVTQKRLGGLMNKELSGLENEETFVELLKSLLEKYPELKEKVLKEEEATEPEVTEPEPVAEATEEPEDDTGAVPDLPEDEDTDRE